MKNMCTYVSMLHNAYYGFTEGCFSDSKNTVRFYLKNMYSICKIYKNNHASVS